MICFFGASVTRQKNGYAEHFLSKINLQGHVFGYGCMHLDNAGLCYIDTVTSVRPTTCFIDFFSTAYLSCCQKTYECLDTIVYKFSLINCKLIFLFFPRQDHSERVPFYNFCKKYLEENKLTYFDLSENIKYCPTLLRDCVHTTPLGSQVYSDYIYDKYIATESSIIIPTNIKKTKYDQIQKIEVDREFTKYFTLAGDCTLFGIVITVGEYSGILDITDGSNNISINTWDQWCHHLRDMLISLQELYISNKCTITISQNQFDTSTYTHSEIDFSLIKKKIVIRSIFFIGDKLQLIDGM